MLYAPAVCENCAAVFHSGQLIAENDGESASYRRSAGPCPRCGGRGTIPEWVFRFHTTATTATDLATHEQVDSLIRALQQQVAPAPPAAHVATDTDVDRELTGPWRGVAVELRRAPADHRAAQLAFLLWIRDRPHRNHRSRGNGASEVLSGTRAVERPYDAADPGLQPAPPFTVIDPPTAGHPGIAITVTSTRRAS